MSCYNPTGPWASQQCMCQCPAKTARPAPNKRRKWPTNSLDVCLLEEMVYLALDHPVMSDRVKCPKELDCGNQVLIRKSTLVCVSVVYALHLLTHYIKYRSACMYY